MKYSDPKLQSLLAAEYILGSLRGAASRRFERLLQSEPGLREAVEYWQERLNPLAESTPPIKPDKRVWATIQNRIRYGTAAAPQKSSAIWSNLNFWRGFSLASIALVIGFTLGNLNKQPPSVYETVAVLHDSAAKPMLVASMENESRSLILEVLSQPENMESGKVMQVWCVPKGGGKPMPIGILESDQNRFELSLDQIQTLHESLELSISIEPEGGSPTDEPTGPVMYRGTII